MPRFFQSINNKPLTYFSLVKIGPTKTSVLGVFEPLTAILIGALLFGESITLRMGLGITICVAAVVFMILKPGKKS